MRAIKPWEDKSAGHGSWPSTSSSMSAAVIPAGSIARGGKGWRRRGFSRSSLSSEFAAASISASSGACGGGEAETKEKGEEERCSVSCALHVSLPRRRTHTKSAALLATCSCVNRSCTSSLMSQKKLERSVLGAKAEEGSCLCEYYTHRGRALSCQTVSQAAARARDSLSQGKVYQQRSGALVRSYNG
eukprot:3882007-Rhodomonas_salina.1